MGTVYEVEDRSTGEHIALKQMLSEDARQLLRFKSEFRVMADLQHPNLIRLRDLGFDEGTWFLTMDLVDGPDIFEALVGQPSSPPQLDAPGESLETGTRQSPGVDANEQTQLPSDTVSRAEMPDSDDEARPPITERHPPACDLDRFCDYMRQIVAALEFLHAHDIVHRDLKPSNVLVGSDGVVKLLDFGLASKTDRTQAISNTGALVGTIAYMAPEQINGQRITPATDLYALGCVMFRLLTGKLPHDGAPALVLRARLDQPAPRVEHLVVGVPQRISELCRALMDRDPELRPALSQVRSILQAETVADSVQDVSASARDFPAEISLPFVGRRQELDALQGLLQRASDGELQVAVVEGNSGIGKSALAGQLVRDARSRGVLCFRGRCYERERLPYVAFDRAVDALTLTLSRWPRERLADIQPDIRKAARIFPALVMLVDSAAAGFDSDDYDAGELAQRASSSFCAILNHCQTFAPLLLVLDDLQWVDAESLRLLDAVLSRCEGRIFLLALTRPTNQQSDLLAGRLEQILQSHSKVTRLALDTLRTDERIAFFEQASRDLLDTDDLSRLAVQTEGHPLLMLQLVDQLARLAPEERGPHLDAIASSDGIVEELLAHLDARARAVLALAATAGGDVDAEVLRAASGLAEGEFVAAVQDLVAMRLLRYGLSKVAAGRPIDEPPERRRRLDVYHDQIREVVYEGLEEAEKRQRHRDLARAIETTFDPKLHVEQLLRHWGEAGETTKRQELALEAAEQAEAKLAFDRAAALLRITLDDPLSAESPFELAARWERLGKLYELTAQQDAAPLAYSRAFEIWEREPPPDDESQRAAVLARLRLRGRLGSALIMAGRIQRGRAVFDPGLRDVGVQAHTARWRQRVTMLWLRFLLFVVHALPESWTRRASSPLLEERLRFFTSVSTVVSPVWPALSAEVNLRGAVDGLRIGNKMVLQRLLASRVLGLVLQGQPTRRALAKAKRDLDLAEQLAHEHQRQRRRSKTSALAPLYTAELISRGGNVPLGLEVTMVHRALYTLVVNSGRARRIVDEAIAAMARRGIQDSHDGAIARGIRITILFEHGDYDAALAACEEEMTCQLNALNIPIHLFFKVLIHAQRGQLEVAELTYDRLEESLESIPTCGLTARLDIARLWLLLGQGRWDTALEHWRSCEASWTATTIGPRGFFLGLWQIGFLEAALGQLHGATLSPALRREALSVSTGLAERGTLGRRCLGHRALALLKHEEGRTDVARKHLDLALEESSRRSSPYWRWLCLEASKDLGYVTRDMELEAEKLCTEKRFALAGGWRGES